LIHVASLQKLLETDCTGLHGYGEGSVADGCHVGTEERETIYLRLECLSLA